VANSPLADAIRSAIKAAVDAALVPGKASDVGATIVGGVALVPDKVSQLALGDPTGDPVQLEGQDAEPRGRGWARDLTGYPGSYDFIIEGIAQQISVTTGTGGDGSYTLYVWVGDELQNIVKYNNAVDLTPVGQTILTYVGGNVTQKVDIYFEADGVTAQRTETTTYGYTGDNLTSRTVVVS
jgi:hypothetical protein